MCAHPSMKNPELALCLPFYRPVLLLPHVLPGSLSPQLLTVLFAATGLHQHEKPFKGSSAGAS